MTTVITETAVERILDRLREQGGPVGQGRGGEWTARCPAHNDRNPSLGVRAVPGRALVYCHAGCETADIMAALGMTLADLFDDRRGTSYTYVSAAGVPTRTVHRTWDKRFRQTGQTRVKELYKLPQVIEAVAAGTPVWLVEGEQDAESLTTLGAVATTAPEGAGNVDKVDFAPLRGAVVIAVPDRDGPGQKWAAVVRGRLTGYAATLTFREARAGKDATDHIAAGYGLDDFTELTAETDPGTHPGQTDDVRADPDESEAGWAGQVAVEALRIRLREEARELYQAQRHARSWTPPKSHGSLADELRIPDEATSWRLDGLLGVGHNALLVAGRKTGKTTMVNNLVRSYADGTPFLSRFPVHQADAAVAIFNYEVDERQYRRWLREAGIRNPERVFALHLRGQALPLKDPHVRRWVIRWLAERGVGLWIIDPYSRAYVGSLDNGNDETQVGAFLDNLDQIKAEAGVSELVMPVHTPKARAEVGEETAIGSQRLEAWGDSMWYLTRDLETGDRFLRAEGRDVYLPEEQLRYNTADRSLSLAGNGLDRESLRQHADVAALISYIRDHDGCTGRDITSALGWGNDRFARARTRAGETIRTEPGKNRSLAHHLVDLRCTGAPEHRSAPVQSGALLSIESTTQHHRRTGPVRSAPVHLEPVHPEPPEDPYPETDPYDSAVSDAGAVCCGRDAPAGGPLVPRCGLCPLSPGYYRKRRAAA
ncbi:MAG TPA: AAA family ATPase [Rugosimonospora sp.]|nr:AAA family ATPase [Rugosimonospora sp.]